MEHHGSRGDAYLREANGRGFFPTRFNLGNPITPLVVAEAICGLLIEITIIATFTQRFFAR